MRRPLFHKIYDFKQNVVEHNESFKRPQLLTSDNIKNWHLPEDEAINYIRKFNYTRLEKLLPLVNESDLDKVTSLYMPYKQQNWVTIVVLIEQIPCKMHTQRSTTKDKTKESKKTIKKEHQVWTISEDIPKISGLLLLDPSEEQKKQIKPGTVIAILNPTIMRRKMSHHEFISLHSNDNQNIVLDHNAQYPVGLYVRSENSETSVCVLGDAKNFGYCKHVNELNTDKLILMKLGQTVKPDKVVKCTQAVNT
jgi:hypothetical protein